MKMEDMHRNCSYGFHTAYTCYYSQSAKTFPMQRVQQTQRINNKNIVISICSNLFDSIALF